MDRYGEDYWTPREAENGYAPGNAVFTDEGVYRVPERVTHPCGDCGGAGGRYEYELDGSRYQRVWQSCEPCCGSGYE